MNITDKKNKTVYRVAYICIGIIMLISGVYRIYDLFFKDDIAKDNAVMINETISDKNGVEFCVTDVDNLKSVGSGYYEVTTDNNFVVVTIKITNNSKKPYDVNSLRFLLDDGESEYEYANDTIFSFDNYMTMDTLNPGISKEYTIVYETPATTNESVFKMKIKPNAFIDKDSVYIALSETNK